MNLHEEINRQQELMGVPAFSVEYFQKRIPFLRSYTVNVAPDVRPHPRMPDRIEMTYETDATNIKTSTKDEIYVFPRASLHSQFFYYSHVINDNTFYVIGIENTIYIEPPANLDPIVRNMMPMIEKANNERLSKIYEIQTPKGQPVDKTKLDEAINGINQKLFQLEEAIGHSDMKL
jgi:hypothetical protein